MKVYEFVEKDLWRDEINSVLYKKEEDAVKAMLKRKDELLNDDLERSVIYERHDLITLGYEEPDSELCEPIEITHKLYISERTVK